MDLKRILKAINSLKFSKPQEATNSQDVSNPQETTKPLEVTKHQEVKDPTGVNLNALPKNIRTEYEKIVKNYQRGSIILKEDCDYKFFIKHVPTFERLNFLLQSGQLLTSLGQNIIANENDKVVVIKQGFERLVSENKVYYKFKNEEYFWWYIRKYYRSAFLEGYHDAFTLDPATSIFSHEEINIYDVFQTVFGKSHDNVEVTNLFYTDSSNQTIISPYKLIQYGREVGKLIKAWEIILQSPFKFEKLFNLKFDERTKPIYKYFEVGALFEQGFITKESAKGVGSKYFYKDKEFSNPTYLSEYIKNDILKTKNTIRQYVLDTLNNSGSKNLHEPARAKLILEYCDDIGVVKTGYFNKK